MARNDFSSSTKMLLSFSETEATKAMVELYGDRLTGLNRGEKFKLASAISLYLGLEHSPGQSIADANRFANTENILSITQLMFSAFPQAVEICLGCLIGESIDSLAAILPAIASYASEDNR